MHSVVCQEGSKHYGHVFVASRSGSAKSIYCYTMFPKPDGKPGESVRKLENRKSDPGEKVKEGTKIPSNKTQPAENIEKTGKSDDGQKPQEVISPEPKKMDDKPDAVEKPDPKKMEQKADAVEKPDPKKMEQKADAVEKPDPKKMEKKADAVGKPDPKKMEKKADAVEKDPKKTVDKKTDADAAVKPQEVETPDDKKPQGD